MTGSAAKAVDFQEGLGRGFGRKACPALQKDGAASHHTLSWEKRRGASHFLSHAWPAAACLVAAGARKPGGQAAAGRAAPHA